MELNTPDELEELESDINSFWMKITLIVVSLLAVTLLFYSLYLKHTLN
jgi:hypothetical protein